jgi:hypothetical protein
MKIYFAGTGSLQKEDIVRNNQKAKRRLLSYFYILKNQPQYPIFRIIKNENISGLVRSRK